MTLSSSKLGDGIANMVPVMTEAEAINNFVTAWEDYFYDSSVLGIKPILGVLSGASVAMRAALVGISNHDAAPALLQAGIIAFWGAVAPSAATIWVTAPLIVSATVPPNLSTISAVLSSVFASNLSGELSLIDSANAVASALHPIQLGGIAAMTPPPPGVTAPIL